MRLKKSALSNEMQQSKYLTLILILSSLSYGFSFYHLNSYIGAVLGCLAALGFVFAAQRKAVSLYLWFLVGLLSYLIAFPWYPQVIRSFFPSTSLALSFFYTLILALSGGFQFLLFALISKGTRNVLPVSLEAVAIGLAWVSCEILMPTMTPWVLGGTQLHFSLLSQTADVGGVHGVSFLVIFLSALLCGIFKQNKKSLQAFLFLSTLFICGFYSFFRTSQISDAIASGTQIGISMVQAGIELDDPDRKNALSRMGRYQELTRGVSTKESSLVVWPESSVGYKYGVEIERIEKDMLHPMPDMELPLIFGGRSEGMGGEQFNSAILLTPDGNINKRYHKQKLVPFAEYLPEIFSSVGLSGLVPARTDLLAASNQVPITVELSSGALSVLTMICYEELWPRLVRQMLSRSQADVLLSISNDNWFGTSSALMQHHTLASWRAIEFRKFLMRGTTTGVTAVVDPLGKTVSQLESHTQGVLQADIVPFEGQTTFARFGEQLLFIMACCGAVLAVFLSLQHYSERCLKG